MRRNFAIFSLSLMLLSACGPVATPFPVDVPSEVSSSSLAEQKPIRYALAPNTGGVIQDGGAIEASVQVEQLDADINSADLGNRFDVAVAYGDLPGGTRSPIMQNVALVINPNALPWQDPAILNIFRHSLRPIDFTQEMDIAGILPAETAVSPSPVEVRSLLANAGWPDGLSFNLGDSYVPGSEAIIRQWEAAGIYAKQIATSPDELQTALADDLLQAALIIWTTPESRDKWVSQFGTENVVDLYTVPISFIAIPDLTITYTPSGWPVPAY